MSFTFSIAQQAKIQRLFGIADQRNANGNISNYADVDAYNRDQLRLDTDPEVDNNYFTRPTIFLTSLIYFCILFSTDVYAYGNVCSDYSYECALASCEDELKRAAPPYNYPDTAYCGVSPPSPNGGHYVCIGDTVWARFDDCYSGYYSYDGTSAVKSNGLPDVCTGNPINTATGNKFQAELDYFGGGLPSLKFERNYNSISSSESIFSSIYSQMFLNGGSWRHNYGRRVLSNSVSWAQAIRPDGKEIPFNKNNNRWSTTAEVKDTLVQLNDAQGNPTGWQYTNTSDNSVEIYNVQGQLLSITDRAGLVQTLTYSDATTSTSATIAPVAGLLIGVSDSFGRQLRFTYDGQQHLITMTDPSLGVYLYSYNINNNITSVTYPDGKNKTYLYENTTFPFALTGILDENGNRYATFTYDSQGRAITTEHGTGGIDKYKLSYLTNFSTGLPVATDVTDPLGTVRTSNFISLLGALKNTGQSQPGGSGCNASTSAMTYDVNGNVASRTDFNGNRTNYTYDLTRNIEISRTEGLTATGATTSQMRTITTEWHSTFRLPTKITEPGLETTYTYDTKGNITHKSLKDLVTAKTRDWNTAYTYAVSGILLSKVEDGPRTDVSDLVTYDYYPEDAVCTGGHLGCRGQLKQITNALNHATLISRYSPHELPEVIKDPNGLTTTMTYDVRQRLISMDVGGELTTYSYDSAGLMNRVTQANGAYLAYLYDNAHRLIEVKDQLGNTRTYTLDNLGNRIKEDVLDPGGQLARSQSRVYDALSRLQSLVQAQ